MSAEIESIWGIDFGTTTTFLSSSGELVPLGKLGQKFLPSIAGYDGDAIVFGDDTETLTEDEKLRSVKQEITDRKSLVRVPKRNTGSEKYLPVDEIVLGILSKARRQALREVEDNDSVRLGCPAMWDAKQRLRLLEIAQRAGLKVESSTLIDEPIAACINWLETQKYEQNGMAVVFDIGGGTLDIALVDVKAKIGFDRKVTVLASFGKREAGDDLDESITDFILERISLEEPGIGHELAAHRGWVKLAARQMKEKLSQVHELEQTIASPLETSISVRLTRDELREIFRPQFRRSLDLLSQTIRNGLVRRGLETVESVRTLTMKNLLTHEEIKFFVLAGGMSKMPILQDLLVEEGVMLSSIDFTHYDRITEKPAPEEAIARGLGFNSAYQTLNLHVPSFDLVLAWTNPDGSKAEEIIHEAYTPLYPEFFPRHKGFHPTFRTGLPTSGFGYVFARTIDGEVLPFRFENGEIIPKMVFRFGTEYNGSKIVLYESGTLIIKNTYGDGQHRLRIKSWPVTRAGSTANNLRVDGTEGLPWYLKPSN